MSDYRIRADRHARHAWKHLGQARELKLQGLGKDHITLVVIIARLAMHTAILYRQMARS